MGGRIPLASLIGYEVRSVTRIHAHGQDMYEITLRRDGHTDLTLLVPTDQLFDQEGNWLDDARIPRRT